MKQTQNSKGRRFRVKYRVHHTKKEATGEKRLRVLFEVGKRRESQFKYIS